LVELIWEDFYRKYKGRRTPLDKFKAFAEVILKGKGFNREDAASMINDWIEHQSRIRDNQRSRIINLQYKKGTIIGGRLQKITPKNILEIIPRSRITGNRVHRIAVDPETYEPVKWTWAYATEKGKLVRPENIVYYQVDPDTGKERKVSLEETNLGVNKIVKIEAYFPKDSEEQYLISDVYEITSDEPSTLFRLYRLAKYLVKTDQIGMVTIVFRRGVISHGGIVTAYIDSLRKRFTVLVKLVVAKFRPTLTMKIPRKIKAPEKIKRKPIWE